MECRSLVYTVFIAWLLVNASDSCANDVIESKSKVISSLHDYLRSDCLYFVESSDFNNNCEIVSTQRRLSDDVISSAVVNTASVIDNSHRLLTSCNRPVYTIFGDNDARATLKMLSDSNKLSGRVWLLFLQDSSNLDEYFLNINIPFDCEFIVAAPLDSDGRIGLTEVYRVDEHSQLKTFRIGSSRFGEGFIWSKTGFYDRRSDLNGIVLKASVSESVLSPLILDVTNKSRSVVSGFDSIILKIFENLLSFKSDPEVPGDKSYGVLQPNGSWIGIMGVLVRNEADMSGVPLTMSPDRFKDVAFSTPYLNEFSRVYIRQPRGNVSLGNLLSPFSVKLWLAFFTSAVVLSVILAQFYKLDGNQGLRGIFFQVLCAVFCQQGSGETSSTSSKRILMFLVYLLGIIVLSSYSCFFISSLTTYTPKLPFTTLKGLLDDGRYSLGMKRLGFAHGEFLHANEPEHKDLKELYDKLVAPHPENLVQTYQDGFKNVCNHNYAFIADENTMTLMEFTCKVVSLDNYFSRRSSALAFPKNSPYVGIFNNKLLKLLSSGIISKHNKDAHYKPEPMVNHKMISASFETIIPILLFGAVGVLVSVIVLALELLKCYLFQH